MSAFGAPRVRMKVRWRSATFARCATASNAGVGTDTTDAPSVALGYRFPLSSVMRMTLSLSAQRGVDVDVLSTERAGSPRPPGSASDVGTLLDD